MAFVRTYLIGSVCFASLVGLGFLASACGSGDDSCEDTLNCGNGGGGTGASGGTGATGGAGGGSGGDGSTCDMSKNPSEEACLVSDEFGVFVSPLGDDTAGNGTKQSPYKTLSKAVTEASASSKHVFACDNGDGYTETSTLTLGADFDGLGLFGGFDCSSWSYSTSAKAKLNGAATALRIENVPASARVEDFEIEAADAIDGGESSFGAIVSSSNGVAIRRVTLSAGIGANGAEAVDGVTGDPGTVAGSDQNGKAGKCTSAPSANAGGLWTTPSSCASLGGQGAGASKGATSGAAGNAGTPNTNVTPTGVDNKGAAGQSAPTAGGGGTDGSTGDKGSTGLAAPAAGSFTSDGFTPGNGKDGANGFPGQGGGGGGSSAVDSSHLTCIGATGGAGGLGGCGGGKGAGGGGGGSSVGLLAFDSKVTLDTVDISAKNAGDGQKGGNAAIGGEGGKGGDGGAGDPGNTIGKGGNGGFGGPGGVGGSGSGGTGGASYALAWKGSPVTKVGTVNLTHGAGGGKGLGGSLIGNGTDKAVDGSDGLSDNEFEQP